MYKNYVFFSWSRQMKIFVTVKDTINRRQFFIFMEFNNKMYFITHSHTLIKTLFDNEIRIIKVNNNRLGINLCNKQLSLK